jgi:hypothetical protein
MKLSRWMFLIFGAIHAAIAVLGIWFIYIDYHYQYPEAAPYTETLIALLIAIMGIWYGINPPKVTDKNAQLIQWGFIGALIFNALFIVLF